MTRRHRWIAGCLVASAALAPVALAGGAPPQKNLNACEGGVKIEPVKSGDYTRVLNGAPVTITLAVNEAAKTVGFTVAGAAVTEVKVKGGPDPAGAVYDFAGGSGSGANLTAPLNPNSGKVYGLSHVCFFSDLDEHGPPELLVPVPVDEPEPLPEPEPESGEPLTEEPETGAFQF